MALKVGYFVKEATSNLRRNKLMTMAAILTAAVSLLLLGGVVTLGSFVNSTCNNELWRLTLSGTRTWTLLTPLGTPPAPREGARIWYDRARDRLVLVGGHQTSGEGDI